MSIEWKKYGTRVDVVPFVLGNGKIRLEVRPELSEVDKTRSEVAGVPAIKSSSVDTGVELMGGQTLAIAGLVQTRREGKVRGLPFVMDVPYVGALFRQTSTSDNEIESLILVTPEFVQAVDAADFPRCGPGTRTVPASDWDLYFKGKLEVPNPCPPCQGGQCQQINPDLATPPGTSPMSGMMVTPAHGETCQLNRSTDVASRSTGNNRYNPSRPQEQAGNASAGQKRGEMPGFRGPVGYDVAE
jgi:pilus assembly protein CpaC